MMRRIFVTTAVVLALSVTACGKTDKTDKAGETAKSAAAAPKAANQPISSGTFLADSDGRLLTIVGKKVSGVGIEGTGQGGVLVYGPYVTLLPGKHRVEFYGSAKDLGKGYIAFQVTSNKGTNNLGASPYNPGANGLLAAVEFTTTEEAPTLETRVVMDKNFQATISKIVIHDLSKK